MVLNAGWTLSFIWSFIKAFLPQHVIDKYVFISGKKEAVKVFQVFFSKTFKSNK
jgi:hypothetical protein